MEYGNNNKRWSLHDTFFKDLMLIVGVNSIGKSRTLNVVSSLSNLLSGKRGPFSDAEYTVTFSCPDSKDDYTYQIKMYGADVVKESLTQGSNILLERDHQGLGSLKAVKIDADLDFKIDKNRLAIVSKRDELQHPFLEPLHEWAAGVIHHRFADDREKETLMAFGRDEPVLDTFTPGIVFLQRGLSQIEGFESAVIKDMRSIGYEISSVNMEYPDDLVTNDGTKPLVISVKEDDLPGRTQQHNMSHGMFRALNTIIKVNFIIHDKNMKLILIDDVGEGLDFKRSKSLVSLIYKKIIDSSKQAWMTTNDQFIMNGIPLENWSIATRDGAEVSYINYENATEKFEEFKFVGLNNFEFFTTEFFK